jgi:GT2 family glycosyltransferase
MPYIDRNDKTLPPRADVRDVPGESAPGEPQPPQLLVSALVVSYNCADALRRCLNALEKSSERERLEIIVVDNGSRDESPRLDSEFPNATFLRLPRNFGFVKALNIAMRSAKTEFLFVVDPRTEVLPGTAMALAEMLEANENAAAVAPLLATPEGGPAPQLYQLPDAATVGAAAKEGRFRPAAPPPSPDEEPVPVEFADLSALMVRTWFVKGLRYIDERYAHFWAGAEIAAQIRRAGKKILLCPAIRAVWHNEEPYPPGMPNSARALLAANWSLGAATYAAKHFGFAAGLKVRIAAALGALGATLSFRDPGYQFSRFMYLVSGQKIDGTQSSL